MYKECELAQIKQAEPKREAGRRLGAIAPRNEASREGVRIRRRLRRSLRQDVATDEVREATQSHGSESPLSSEGRSPNGSTRRRILGRRRTF